MIAHELYGNAYDSNYGQLKRNQIDPNSGIRESENSAMDAENEFNKGAGRPEAKCYGDKPLDGKSKC